MKIGDLMLRLIGLVPSPPGYRRWIARERAKGNDYALTDDGPESLPNTDETWSTLNLIRSQVEDGAAYWPDPDEDDWRGLQRPSNDNHPMRHRRIGDCEDFAISFFKAALDRGLPRAAFRFCYGPNKRGGYHAALAIRIRGKPPLIYDQAHPGFLWSHLHPLIGKLKWFWEKIGHTYWWETMP